MKRAQSAAVAVVVRAATWVAVSAPICVVDKAETWGLSHQLGGQPLVDLILEHTHTCYDSVRGARHEWGYGCGECPACALRKRGYVAWREGKPSV